MSTDRDYRAKRSYESTPEPQSSVAGNVDPGSARAGTDFVIQQHHARRLHFDLRLEMFNGDTPVLVSWAVPRNLPTRKKEPHLVPVFDGMVLRVHREATADPTVLGWIHPAILRVVAPGYT